MSKADKELKEAKREVKRILSAYEINNSIIWSLAEIYLAGKKAGMKAAQKIFRADR